MDILDGEILPPNAVSVAPHGRNNISVQFVLPEHCISVSNQSGVICVYFILDKASAMQLASMTDQACSGGHSSRFAN